MTARAILLPTLLLVGCAGRGPLASLPPVTEAVAAPLPPPPPSPRVALEEAVGEYLEALPLDPPSYAPATGGLFGWIVPQVYVWFPSVDGEMVTDDGDRVDFQSDLGLEEGDPAVMPQLQVSLGAIGLRFSAYLSRFEGQGTVDRTFTFGGVTFPVTETITSKVRIDNYRLLSFLPLVKTDFFTLAFQGGISFFDVEGTVTGSSSGTARESAGLPLPSGGVVVQLKVGRFLFEADVAGFTIDFGDIGATFVDAQASVGVVVFKVVAVRGGYRVVYLDAEADGFRVEGTLSGFFVGLSFQF